MKKFVILLVYFVLICYLVSAQGELLECEKEGFAVVQSTNCVSYYYCFKSANNEFYPIEYKCPAGEEFSLLLLKCIPEEENGCGMLPETSIDDPIFSEEFVCPSQGRFPDVESLDCKSYFTCTADLIPTANTCPSVTIFSWTLMKCVMPETFTCPNGVVTTTELATTEVVTTEAATTEAATTEAVTTEAATTEVERTTSNPESFVCIAEGRFPDPQTVDCKSYYLCAKTPSGNVEATLNQCPSTTIFSSSASKCVAPESYVCPQTVTPTSTVATSTTTIELSTEESTTVETTETVELTTLVTDDVEQTTPMGSTTSVDTTIENMEPTSPTNTEEQSTTSNAITTEEPSVEETTTVQVSTTDETTTKDPPVESFTCTALGRFPNLASSDCKSYYLCTENEEGTIEAMLNNCPALTVFDPTKEKCVMPNDYQCMQGESTTTDGTEEPITSEVTTEKPPTTEAFACQSAGRFADPTSTDCKSYYLCTGNAEGSYEAVLTQCPTSTLFSTESMRCVLSTQYQCPTDKPSTVPIGTTTEIAMSTTETPTGSEQFVCTREGRQPDMSRTECNRYKYCLLTATNEFLEYTFYCPAGTYFDPTDLRCSTNYTCPSKIITTSTETVKAIPFTCATNGRFSDPSSAACEAYVMCLITITGDILQYNFNCPYGFMFDPKEAKCVTDYKCA